MKMKKRVTSLLMALLMVLTLLPVTAWAGGYYNLATFDVSVWEDGVDPVNCSESTSGEGWSYDASSAVLTLDGFTGKYLTIGKPMTIILKSDSVNDIEYGLYFGAVYGTVTIAGSGKLKVGNAIECSETDLIISAEVEIEKRELPTFQANITTENDLGDVYVKTIELSDGGAYTGYTGLIIPFNGTIEMQGGKLTIIGTEYGIYATAVNQTYGGTTGHNITGGQVSIMDTTVSAVYISPSGFDWDEISGDPSVVFQRAKAFNQDGSALTWKAEQDNGYHQTVQLYTADGEIAKSATFKDASFADEKRIVSVAVLDAQPIIMIEGVDSGLSYAYDHEKGEEDLSKPYTYYDVYFLKERLTVRAVFSDGTVKEGRIKDIPEGNWSIDVMIGNNYESPWEVGNTYEVWLECSNSPDGGWNQSRDPYTIFKVKIVPAVTGDIDGDGKTTLIEVQAIYEYLTGQTSLTWGRRNLLDVNGDKILDVYDLQYCYELAANIRPQ